MPGLNGLAVQEALVLRGTDRPIIFLTGRGTIPESVQAMRAGAVDFLTKPVGNSELMSAIKSAEDRDRTQRHIVTQRKAVLQRVAKLTRRERQVLSLVVAGQQNKWIAHELGVCEKTIKVHRSRVHQKMEVRSLAELVRMTVAISW
jgi:FixJ family two-component response regulator